MNTFPIVTNIPAIYVELLEISDANNDTAYENTIKLSKLGDRSLIAFLPAVTMGIDGQGAPVEQYNFNDGDEIDVIWRGIDANGLEVSWSQAIKVSNRYPSRAIEFQVPSNKVKALASSKAYLWYRLTQGPHASEPGKIIHAPVLEITIDGLVLPAPLVVEAVGDTLDPEKLGGTATNRFATVKIDYPGMAAGDFVEVYRNGMPVENIPVSDSNLRRRPLQFQWKKADLLSQSGDVMAVHYVVYRGNPEEAYVSKVMALRVSPSLSTLPPFINELRDGRLDADAYIEKVFVHIPSAAALVGDVITLHWIGTGEVGSLQDRLPVTARSISGDIKFNVYDDIISANTRRLVKVYYTIARTINGRLVTLRSPDLIFFVGNEKEQQAFTQAGSLGALIVKDAPDGVLATTPAIKAATLVAPFAATQVGDEVSVYWRAEGEPDSQLVATQAVTPENVDSDLSFTAPADLVGGSVGKRASLFYVIKRPGDPEPSYLESPYTVVRIGALTGDSLLPPIVREADEDDRLDPMHALKGVVVEVPAYPGMAVGDRISVNWGGGPGPGTVSVAVTVSKIGPVMVNIPAGAVAYSVDYEVLVSYEVVRVLQTGTIYSPSRLIAELGFWDEELTVPRITQAPAGVLDLPAAADPITVVVDRWPLIAPGQRVWLNLEGTASDNSPVVITMAYAVTLTDADAQRSLSFNRPKADFAGLKAGSRLKVVFKVAWDGDVNEAEARLFPAYAVEIKQRGTSTGSPLSITSHDMNLGGFYVLVNDSSLTNPPINAFAIRTATGGRAPYAYFSGNPAVARVDAATGKVTALRNGVAIITATDQDGTTVTYRVVVTGVYALEQIPVVFHTYGVCLKSAMERGLRIPSLQEWKTMMNLQNGNLNLPYMVENGQSRERRVWTSDVQLFKRAALYPENAKTILLIDTSIILPGDSPIATAGETAHGFGLRN